MLTAARGATLILLGALLAQAPLTAQAYQPREPEYSGPSGATAPPTSTPTSAPTSAPTVEPTMTPTAATPTATTPTAGPTANLPVDEPAARSWSEVVKQVTETSPGDLQVRSADKTEQTESMLRCFKLDTENYCLGLGFVDKLPTGAQLQSLVSSPTLRAADEAGVEQDIPTGDLTPADFVAQRAAMPKSTRVAAELDEMQAAWNGREKARELRELVAAQTPPVNPETPSDEPTTQATATPTSTATPTATPTATATVVPTRTAPTVAPSKPVPSAPQTPAAPVKTPASAYIMKGFQTSQEKGYWCGPATFQSIDWADDNQKDTQASWAKDLGSTTGGTAISAMVKQTNVKTAWPKSAGTYVVQNVSDWNAQTFFTVHQKHLGVYKAPVIEHVQLLKRYFPYLAFNHSGHYQVGRGYDKANGTIAIFEVFNERRFNSRGNVTDGPRNIPASALFNATLANSFQNIGL
ncbi:peptidase C39-like protein [Kribbella pratensis]|uniref:Peptidase C39-like protein n=2 Tax=Kribbella pratensis TaxID=2512112 RepID=A0A4R8CNG2_9ACTN|nr:peptidase C39-like protein [Kribbella pratensis]